MENNNLIIFRMGKVSRKKQKLTKAAKSAKLDGGDAEIKVENGPKKLIDEALQYFKNGDAQSAKKIARRVIKVFKIFFKEPTDEKINGLVKRIILDL